MLACPSTGNLANATAAAAARAGIRSVVLIPKDLERPKVLTTAVYGGTLVAVDGTYDDVNRLASEIAGEQEDWAFVNVNVRPYYAEGSKTLGFEVAEQLGWRLPEQVVVPVASGSQLTKIDKAFGELGRLGLVEPTPYRVFGAQAAGCSPVAAAYAQGHDVVRPVRPDTIAKSLAIGNPADGPYVLDVARRTGGAVESVTDDEIRDGIRLLARTEGIFAETAGGVTVATLKKLAESGQLDPDAETVVFNTGDGLKTLDAIADRVGPDGDDRPDVRGLRARGTGMSVQVRVPTVLRTYTGGAKEVSADGLDGRRGLRRARLGAPRHQGPGGRRAGPAAPLRQRVRRQRGRPVRRRPGHPGGRRHPGVDHPLGGGRLRSPRPRRVAATPGGPRAAPPAAVLDGQHPIRTIIRELCTSSGLQNLRMIALVASCRASRRCPGLHRACTLRVRVLNLTLALSA